MNSSGRTGIIPVSYTHLDVYKRQIVDKAVEYKLGARGLRSIVETIKMDAMFEIPSEQKDNFVVTLAYACLLYTSTGTPTNIYIRQK